MWIYLVFPFVGSLLSVIFHELVFKKALIAVGEDRRGISLLDDED